MIKHIKCNMFDSGADIFCHQVNCQGEMNTGVAAQVRQRYPWVFASYRELLKLAYSPEMALGIYQPIFIDEERIVINIFGQVGFGYDGSCYTDYVALKQALQNIAADEDYFGKTIAFPYKMGCHRGGGDWDIVYKIIYNAFRDSDCEVLICEYDEEFERQKLRNMLLATGKEMLYDDSVLDEAEEYTNIAVSFDITKEEDKAINAWVKNHIFNRHQGHHYGGAIGGTYEYIFTPTSIGEVGTIKCTCGDSFTFRELK